MRTTSVPHDPPSSPWLRCTAEVLVLLVIQTEGAPLAGARGQHPSPGGACAVDAGDAGATLPDPILALDFDQDEEWESTGACFAPDLGAPCSTPVEGATFAYEEGRTGRAARPKAGHIALPARMVNPAQGTIAFWLGSDGFYALEPNVDFRILDSDTTPNGSKIYLGPRRSGGATYSRAGLLEFSLRATLSGALDTARAHVHDWSAGDWRHVVATWGNQVVRIYVDGRLAGEAQRSHAAPDLDESSRVYLLGSPTFPAGGSFRVDSLRSYGVELTHDQVIQLYTEGLDTEGPPPLVAGRLEWQFLGGRDGFGLRQISDRDGCARKTTAAASRQLWQLRLQQAVLPPQGQPVPELLVNNTAALTASLEWSRIGRETVLEWNGIPLPRVDYRLPGTGAIDVQVRLRGEPRGDAIHGRVRVRLRSKEWTLAEVQFPRIGGLAPLHDDPANTHLIVPDGVIGTFRANPFVPDAQGGELLGRRLPYPSHYMSMQWAGLLNRDRQAGGLYVEARDGSSSVKAFCFDNALPGSCPPPEPPLGSVLIPQQGHPPAEALLERTSDPGVDIGIIQYPEGIGTAGNGLSMRWDAVVALQDGSWYDLARRYRDFALRQRWMRKGPLAERRGLAQLPEWMANAGLIHGMRTGETSRSFAEELARQEVADPGGHILFHFISWQGAAGTGRGAHSQENDMPFVEPRDDFQAELSETQGAGISVAPYFLPTHWDVAFDTLGPGSDPLTDPANPWVGLGGADSACRDPYDEVVMLDPDIRLGDVPPRPVDPPDKWAHLAWMDPASHGWNQVVVDAIGRLSAHGMNGWYLDFFTPSPPCLCFSRDHGHPPGGGSHWVKGYRRILRDLRREVGRSISDLGFYSESFGEPYIDLVDGQLTLLTSAERPLPLAMAVYHDHTQFLGGLPMHAKDSIAGVIAKQGQHFVWGGMIGFQFGRRLIDDLHIRPYLLALAQLRRRWQEFVVLGDMLRPIDLRLLNEPATGEPPRFASPGASQPIPEMTLSVVSFYPFEGQLDPEDVRFATMRVPRVVSTTWAANRKRVGILVASLEAEGATVGPRVVYVPLEPRGLGLPPRPSVCVRSLHEDRALGVFPGQGGVQLELPAQEVVLIELSPRLTSCR